MPDTDTPYNSVFRLTMEASDFDERFDNLIEGYDSELRMMRASRENLDDLISDRENLIKMLHGMKEIASSHVTKPASSGASQAKPTPIRR